MYLNNLNVISRKRRRRDATNALPCNLFSSFTILLQPLPKAPSARKLTTISLMFIIAMLSLYLTN
jgi:hypothetical protein